MGRQACGRGYANEYGMDFASGYETASDERACGRAAKWSACEGTWSGCDYESACGAKKKGWISQYFSK